MSAILSSLPDSQSLADDLTLAFQEHGRTKGRVTLVDREPVVIASTYPSEIVTCRFDDGTELQVFCKHELASNLSHTGHGHRRGVAYEAAVYRHVLAPLGASVPDFYGASRPSPGSPGSLFSQYLADGLRLTWTDDPNALPEAARWIGGFHAAAETLIADDRMSFLRVYDWEYYAGWARRTLSFAAHLGQESAWLERLCERFEGHLRALLTFPRTIVHGEYYPKNILSEAGTIYPVDWESAAVAFGELDLAALTEGWSEDVRREAEVEYQHARWRAGPPAEFEWALRTARLYWLLRWLGDRPGWITDGSAPRRFEELRRAGEQLGLI